METLLKTPKTKRGQKTLQRILNSAEKHFYEKGYHNTSISDITSGADIALGTYYIYFNDKYNLYKYLLLHYNSKIRKAIRTSIEGKTNRLDIERTGFKVFLEFVRENKSAYHIIWESLYIDYQLFRTYYESFAIRYIAAIMNAQNKNEIKKLNPKTIVYMMMGITNFIGLKWIMFDDEKEFDQVVDEIMEILQNGLFIEQKQV